MKDEAFSIIKNLIEEIPEQTPVVFYTTKPLDRKSTYIKPRRLVNSIKYKTKLFEIEHFYKNISRVFDNY